MSPVSDREYAVVALSGLLGGKTHEEREAAIVQVASVFREARRGVYGELIAVARAAQARYGQGPGGDGSGAPGAPAAAAGRQEPVRSLADLVAAQAEDARLWFTALPAPATAVQVFQADLQYVRNALRALHAAVEGRSPRECAAAALRQAVAPEGA